jgi:L-lactate utilization protein LutC
VGKPQKQQPSNPSSEPVRKPEAGNTVNNASEVVDLSEAEELVAANPKKWEKVLEKAVREADEKIATMLADLSLEEIALFVTEYLRYRKTGERPKHVELFVKQRLLKPSRLQPFPSGKLLLEAYKEVFGNE